MFDLYVEQSPAIFKAAIMLEECGLEHRCIHVPVSEGKQHSPEFRKLSPNSKIPVLVDHEPTDGGAPLVVFESGAILVYLAEKTGRFLATEPRRRSEILQWLFWQTSGLSPMSGQAIHFIRYAPEHTREYGQLRYFGEVRRLFGVLDTHLEGRDFIAGDYSIADMGTYGWVNMYDRYKWTLDEWPNVKRWWGSIAGRPAVKKAYETVAAARSPSASTVATDDFNRNMFGEAAAKAMAKT
jgi:GST-like protein